MKTKPLAVVIGFIGKFPVAGMALYNLHYLIGLRELGYAIHYVERVNRPEECYDPSLDAFVDDAAYALRYVPACLDDVLLRDDRWSFIDRAGVCHGAGWDRLVADIARAAFVLTLCDATWFDELARCPRRAFLDGDPVFTQTSMLEPGSQTAVAVSNYPTLFTYCARMGASDCAVPDLGRTWIGTSPVVATAVWQPAPTEPGALVSTVMNWGAWSEVELGGRRFGHKNREFERFIDLPARSARRLVLAVGGPAPKARLQAHGWDLVDPLEVTGTIGAYRSFIGGSRADLGIAKHAYVASRSGWFSDRSTCYLASGRPVLHQDTGFTDWLPVGAGVLAFSGMDDLLDALDRLDADYERHARAAREIAEEYFEARNVLAKMLDAAGFR